MTQDTVCKEDWSSHKARSTSSSPCRQSAIHVTQTPQQKTLHAVHLLSLCSSLHKLCDCVNIKKLALHGLAHRTTLLIIGEVKAASASPQQTAILVKKAYSVPQPSKFSYIDFHQIQTLPAPCCGQNYCPTEDKLAFGMHDGPTLFLLCLCESCHSFHE